MSTPEEILSGVVARFSPEAAKGVRVTYELQLRGDAGGVWHVVVADEKCQLHSGPAADPDVTIVMSAEDWRKLTAGQLDAAEAFFAGRIEVRGNLSLALQLQSLFGL